LCPNPGFEAFGRRYTASIPILRIIDAANSRPMANPSVRSMSRNIRLPANGCSKCSSSILRMIASSAAGTGRGS
jgi:hypothetical protein